MADSSIEKTVAKAEDKIPYEYTLSMDELLALYYASQEDAFRALIQAFTLGFIKGTRAYSRKRVPVL